MDTAMEWAQKISRRPTIAIESAKNLINQAWGTKTYDGLQAEGEAWAKLFSTEDQKEGARAFLEKRKPVFKGK